MSDFQAKMHQIRFQLGLRPRLRWGSLQRSPDPLARFKGAYFYGEGKESEGKGSGKKEGREKGEGGCPRLLRFPPGSRGARIVTDRQRGTHCPKTSVPPQTLQFLVNSSKLIIFVQLLMPANFRFTVSPFDLGLWNAPAFIIV